MGGLTGQSAARNCSYFLKYDGPEGALLNGLNCSNALFRHCSSNVVNISPFAKVLEILAPKRVVNSVIGYIWFNGTQICSLGDSSFHSAVMTTAGGALSTGLHDTKDSHAEGKDDLASIPTHEVVYNNTVRAKVRKSTAVDEAAKVLARTSERVDLTPEEDRRILRKIDRYVLPAMLLVYFLQQLDKSSLSYTAVFDIVGQANLVGSQYSWLSSIVYLAQLVFQPLSSYALVRLPVGKWVFFNLSAWGICVAASSAAHNFMGLFLARMFLGIFEASIGKFFLILGTL